MAFKDRLEEQLKKVVKSYKNIPTSKEVILERYKEDQQKPRFRLVYKKSAALWNEYNGKLEDGDVPTTTTADSMTDFCVKYYSALEVKWRKFVAENVDAVYDEVTSPKKAIR
ncbi:hypothetical protein BC941DRAFT_466512 [Chlamydoabsidia padenii]|nr:hypothetical protein BC941DRAFT_466512 [Chlamydoabsidia padenii]